MTSSRWTPGEWRRIEAVLDAVVDLPAGERAAALDRLCADDPPLRAAVDELLQAERDGGSVLDAAVERWSVLLLDVGAPARAELVGRLVGPFRATHEVGHGGMGVVYLAERADGQFEQQVALKVVQVGLADEALRAQFLAERRILARLDHPGIARLIDGGVLDDGRPWFAMEFVDGVPLTRWCDEHALDVRARLALFLDVCDAVADAHRNLVLHLDLKPANILVTPAGQVKLLDFGISRLIRQDPDADEDRPSGPRALTPEYAAPELLRGEPVTVTTDTWALGTILYELLAGRAPFAPLGRGRVSAGGGRPEPPPPSVAAAEAGAADPAARRRARRVAGDLDAVVMKAVENDPDRRYLTVAALTADLGAWLADVPVSARPAGPAYRLRKLVRRHRVGVAAACAVALALVGGMAGTAWQARKARREALKAEQVKDYLVGVFADADPQRTEANALTADELLARGAERVRVELSGQPDIQSEMLLTVAQVYRNLGMYAEAVPLVDEAVTIRTGLHGARSEPVAAALNERGWLQYLGGDWEAAEGTLRDVVALRRRLRATGAAELAQSIDNLAEVLRVRGGYAEAETLAREALGIRRRTLGDHVDVATSLNNLGVIVRQTASEGDAEALFREALEMRRRLQGPDHPEALVTQGNLALWLREHGRREEAKAILEDLLARQRARYGDDHPLTLSTLNNLASLHRDLGELERAAETFREVLAGWERRGGAVHPNALTTRNNLAAVLRETGDLQGAETQFREVLEVFTAQLGRDHPNTAVAMQNLASTLAQEKRTEEAEPLFVEAMGVARRAWPEGHPLGATFALGYGRFLAETARCDSALAPLREAVGALATGTSEIIPGSAAEARMTLGSCLLDLDHAAEAEPLLLEAWRAWEGKDASRRAAGALARTYAALGRDADAALWRGRSEQGGEAAGKR